jgi:tetratricopeptide (TPR) repeat protein
VEKVIEIKRRAQRCILSGDLDGAMAEYEKLVATGDRDPMYCVLLADLLFKKGMAAEAEERYLEAVVAYERQSLYKQAIAVCKKMSRLSIAPIVVSRRLGELYERDGLPAEAALCYVQHADLLIDRDRFEEARDSLVRACEMGLDQIRPLERLGEVEVLAGHPAGAVRAWDTAADRHEAAGHAAEAKKWRNRAEQLRASLGPEAASAAASGDEGGNEGGQADGGADAAGGATGAGDGATAFADVFGRLDEPPGLGASARAGEAPAAGDGGAAQPDPFDRSGRNAPEWMPASPAASPATPSAEAPAATPGVWDFGIPRAAVAPAASGGTTATESEAVVAAAPSVPAAEDADVASDGVEVQAGDDAHVAAAGGWIEDAIGGPAIVADGGLPGAAGGEREVPAAEAAFEVATAEGHDAQEAGGVAAAVAGPQTGPEPTAADRPAAPDVASGRVEEVAAAGTSAVAAAAADAPAEAARASTAVADSEDAGLAEVAALLQEAQQHFHQGERAAASGALVRAAQAYDRMGRYDSAAAIYRSLGHSTDSSLQLMLLWMKNCQRRNDSLEAARVACDLGDRALNDGDVPAAREWFERARSYDPASEIAGRRLQAMEGGGSSPGADAAAAPAEDGGQLSIRTDREEPVIIDLGTLIEEFQRGAGEQLASDPQGHYDLAMSYREMGLFDAAVESFRVAAREPSFFLRSTEMIGRCLLEVGQFDEAAEELRAALAAPDLDREAAHDLRYQLGLALEAAGRAREALAEFEQVYAAQANYLDVAMKIRVLRKTVESL